MSHANYKEILLNSYLSISDSTSGLKEIGYAKLVFFILFLEEKELDIKSIIKLTADYINSHGIPEKSVVDALNLLKARRLVQEDKDKFSILPEERSKTEKQLDYSKKVSAKIIQKRFPRDIEASKIEDWFNETNEKYFSAFTDVLIKLYSKKESLILEVDKILIPIINQYGLDKYKEDLLQGYREFLLSSDRDEEEKIWSIMQSLLAAKVVTVDLSPDFLSIDKYTDAEIVLDTNILFANSLSSSTGIEDTMCSFGKIAKTIGAKLCVTEETMEEYKTVCDRRKEEMIKLWNNYSVSILEKANRRDDFFRSLLLLGCKNEEDVERFFSVVEKIPEKIGDSKINIIKHDEIYDKAKDKELFNDIKEAWSQRHGEKWQKTDNVVIHDLIITKLCKKYSKDKKMFALTRDLSLEALSLKWVGEKEDSVWRSLYSLVQVLAINGGGPDFDPSDMAPLVKIFIEQEDFGRSDNFDKRDLLKFTELSDRINELPETKTINLLNKIHKANMSNTSDQQSFKDVKLELERSLVKKTSELSEVISEKDEKINKLQGELNKSRAEKEKSEKTKKIILFAVRTVFKFIGSFILFYILGDALFNEYAKDGATYNVIQIILFILSPLYWIITDFKKTFYNKYE
ncbi:MAG: hypothetical protein BWX82_00593 [Parcubacteria group bacterium ADurb.Bin115]|nr:MAG: hypothetical protein BWX82_00593 [Parcubacteria group bacterium ADurb.Bin115]